MVAFYEVPMPNRRNYGVERNSPGSAGPFAGMAGQAESVLIPLSATGMVGVSITSLVVLVGGWLLYRKRKRRHAHKAA
jgi:hypothetical protein